MSDGILRSRFARHLRSAPGAMSLLLALTCAGCSGPETSTDAGAECSPPFTVDFEPVCVADGRRSDGAGWATLADAASGDLDGDGLDDRAAVLIRDSSGSGVFYYLSVVLRAGNGGWRPAGDVFLGDRIGVDSIAIETHAAAPGEAGGGGTGLLVVRYRKRHVDEPMTAPPSVDVTRRWRVDDARLVAVPR